jgi:tetratricopeptide (TPR) repeat protein
MGQKWFEKWGSNPMAIGGKMKFVIRHFLILVAFSFLTVLGQEYKDCLLKADKYYEAGDKEKAKEYYLKAAELGSADAHYSLAAKFIVTKEESIFHFSEAAKLGHGEALRYALDELLFRANSLTLANPQKALELYEIAKKRNPSLELFDEEYVLDVVKKCAEAGPFDGEKFIQQYHLQDEISLYDGWYDVWELAEEASKGGRFGEPNPKLVFQLISRGGCVPTELELAVTEFYDYWKKGIIKEFNICDHVTSGRGQNYCANRAAIDAAENYQIELKSIMNAVNEKAKMFVEPASLAAVEFFEAKAWNEEMHGGSGYVASALDSIYKQKIDFLSTIKKINNGYIPQNIDDLSISDKELNETYKSIVEKLTSKPIEGHNFIGVDHESVIKVQRLWIPYRDRCAALFARLSPAKTEDFWKSWLTQIRIHELKEIEDFWKSWLTQK